MIMSKGKEILDLPSTNDSQPVPSLLAPPFVAITEANRENLEAHYQKIRAEATKESYLKRLEAFVAHLISAKRVSINLSTQSLLKFLRSGEYLNIHDLIARGIRKPETVFYYQTRCAIEEALGYTEEMRKLISYGALNTGNLGAINFGLCCMLLKPTAELQYRLCFFKQNSLSYRREEYAKLTQDVALWENVHQLAVIKHQEAIKARESPFLADDINGLVLFYSETLRLSDFIEAHIWGKLTPEAVAEVRVPRKDFDWVMRCLTSRMLLERLTPSEKRRVSSLATVIKTLQEFHIPITLM